jgi:SAM-dependent methyltransferase
MMKRLWPFHKKNKPAVKPTAAGFDPGAFPSNPSAILPSNHSGFPLCPHGLPLPHQELMVTVSYGTPEQFYYIGEQLAHLVTHFLPKKPRVLDVGCGCGKVARFLLLNPDLHYTGFDIFSPSIVWCNNSFGKIAGDRFVFKHYNGYSSIYNPQGTISPCEYKFPVENGGVNFVIAASLFTHLLEEECEHFLSEVHRVLETGGLALISIHDQPASGKKYSGDHSRVDIDVSYFKNLAGKHALILKEDIGNFLGQRALLFENRA